LKNILLKNNIGKIVKIDKKTTIYWFGNSATLNKLIEIINQNIELDTNIIKRLLVSQEGHFAFILKYHYWIYAASDVISSYPLFYTFINNEIIISNSAKILKSKYYLNDINRDSLLEFYACGYVTGKDTVYQNLFKINAGEILSINTNATTFQSEQYFTYSPDVLQKEKRSTNDYINELNNIVDNIFNNIIHIANGDPIWIPLSGGLDSRFIVSKLKSLGYQNLFSFSYGPQGNYEVKTAEKVAKVLDIPWMFIQSNSSNARRLFNAPQRREYWDYASGYYTLPSMMEYESIHHLNKKDIIPKNAIIINGQTGDFITGGHIPNSLITKGNNVNSLILAIINKHYSVWESIESKETIDRLKNKIIKILKLKDKSTLLSKEELASYYEFWEWQGRQAMSVVNGQRLYDYFGYRWMLPFWDRSLLSFYQSIPLELRLGQKLYIKYLEHYNYKNLFKNYPSETRRWRFPLLLIVKPISIFFRLMGLNNNNVYKYFSFWSHYSNQYAFYGLSYFMKNIRKAVVPPAARGVIALGINRWMEENVNEWDEIL